MPRRLLKRYIPNPEAVKQHRHLKWLAGVLEDPYLFHLNRRSVSGAFATGLFWAMMPIPLQMLASALTAIVVRVNLPLSVALVWITNPLTLAPVLYFNYLVGTWILGQPEKISEFKMSMEWMGSQLHAIWGPLLFGSLVVGAISGLLGYVGIRSYWRWQVIENYRQRRQKRLNRIKDAD